MKIALLFPLLLLLTACGDSATVAGQRSDAEISVSIDGAAPGTVYLIGTLTDRRFRVDSAQVTAGEEAVFTRDGGYPMGFYIAYYPDKTALQFLVDEDQEFSITAQKNDLIGTATSTGSIANDLLYQSLRFERVQQPNFESVNATIRTETPGTPAYNQAKADQDRLLEARKTFLDDLFAAHPDNFFTTFKRAGQNPELRTDLVLPDGSPDNDAQVNQYRLEFWDNVDFSDTTLLRTPVITNKLERYMNQLTPQNAQSVIESADHLIQKVLNYPEYFQLFANWITLKYEPGNTTLMDGSAVFVHMIQNYFTQERAFWSDSMTIYGLQQRAGEMAQSLMGQTGPNITVPDINGEPKTLFDLDAPYLIVYMYNPTCEHCIEETPKLVNFLKTRNDIDVFAVALDTEPGPWKNFVQQFGISDWTNVSDPSGRSIYKTYYVDHTPELYLLNEDRVIIGKNLKASQIADVIARNQ